MNHDIYAYIFLMGLTTILIRILPLTLIRREIKNQFLRSFLYYVPYVTLAVMTVPGIFYATRSVTSGLVAFVLAGIAAFISGNLFNVAATACIAVFVTELFLF